jgi:hypothetical protein
MKNMGRCTHFLIGAVVLFITTLANSDIAWAGTGSIVAFKAGFGNSTTKGLSLPGIGIYESSPLLADLNHDGKLEIVIGSGRDPSGNYNGQGYLTAISSNGTILWSVQARPANEIASGKLEPPFESSPTVLKDINGDGWDDIVIGLGGLACCGENWDGGVAAYSGKTGARLWVFNSDDWLGHVANGYLDGVFSTPAVGDMNGDGNQEIAFGSWDNCIYLLDRLGNPLWTNKGAHPEQNHCKGNHGYYNEDTVWSSPALADLNGDGMLEVVIGADVTAGNALGDSKGGYLLVLDRNGTPLARTWLDETIYSSPAVGDIDKDGKAEIAIGTGTVYNGVGHYINTYRYVPNADVTKSLVLKWSVSTNGQVFSSPALADLNGDGYLDVIAMSYAGDQATCATIKNGNRVYAISGPTGGLLWNPVSLSDMFGNQSCISSSPVVADIDGSGQLKILFGYSWEVAILNRDGSQYTAASATDNSKPSFYAYCTITGVPAVGDIDGDGYMEIVAGGSVGSSACGDPSSPNKGSLKVWQVSARNFSQSPWPLFRQNNRRTGSVLVNKALPIKVRLPVIFRG